MSVVIPDSVPIIEIDKRSQTYIDYIDQENIVSVVRGSDRYERPFYAMRVIIDFGTTKTEYIQTFFRRYTLGEESGDPVWMGCGHAGRHFLVTNGGITDKQKELLQRIVNSEVIVLSPEDGVMYRIMDRIDDCAIIALKEVYISRFSKNL